MASAEVIGTEVVDTKPIDTDTYDTSVRRHLLHAWAHVVGDPAAHAATCTFEGVPAEIEADMVELKGALPEAHDDEKQEILATGHVNFGRYAGVEKDEEAVKSILG